MHFLDRERAKWVGCGGIIGGSLSPGLKEVSSQPDSHVRIYNMTLYVGGSEQDRFDMVGRAMDKEQGGLDFDDGYNV